MTTPKLQLRSLSEERPFPSNSQYLLVFLRGDIDEVFDVGSKLAASHYIQNEAPTDCDRFYLTTTEVAEFLVKHDLIKLPVTKEQQAYSDAFKAWIAAPESFNVNKPYYHTLRQAFIKFHVEQEGFTFSDALYTNYCF